MDDLLTQTERTLIESIRACSPPVIVNIPVNGGPIVVPVSLLALVDLADRLAPNPAAAPASVVTPAEAAALNPDELCRCIAGDLCPRPIPFSTLPDAQRCTRSQLADAGFELDSETGKPVRRNDSHESEELDEDGNPR